MATRYRLKPTLKFSTFDPVVPPFPGQSAADSLAGEDESRSQHHATKPKDYPSSHYDKEDRPSNKRKNKGKQFTSSLFNVHSPVSCSDPLKAS